jgi:hypothetical protein
MVILVLALQLSRLLKPRPIMYIHLPNCSGPFPNFKSLFCFSASACLINCVSSSNWTEKKGANQPDQNKCLCVILWFAVWIMEVGYIIIRCVWITLFCFLFLVGKMILTNIIQALKFPPFSGCVFLISTTGKDCWRW